MEVYLLGLRLIVIDDEAEIADMEPSRCDIGRDQHIDGAGFECCEDGVALGLAHIALEHAHLEAALVKALLEAVGTHLGLTEYQYLHVRMRLEDAHQVAELLPISGFHIFLDDSLSHLFLAYLDDFGMLDVFVGYSKDIRFQRRRKEDREPLLRELVEYLADLVYESHVEHHVRLVKDDDVEFLDVHCPAPAQIKEPAGCRDKDVHSPMHILHLALEALPAVYDVHAEIAHLPDAPDLVANLDGEFPRGCQDERFLGFPCDYALYEADAERCGLAGAGLAPHKQVMPCDQSGYGLLLDFGRLKITKFLESGQSLFIKA